MDILALILTIFLGGSALAFVSGKFSQVIPGIVAFLTTATATVLYFTSVTQGNQFLFNLAGLEFIWSVDAYANIFMMIVLGLGTLATLYSIQYMQGKERLGSFYANFLLTIGAMFGILISRDFISFFIFWEIMTWSSFLIVIWNGVDFKRTGIWYMVFSAIGAYAMLMGMVMIHAEIGTFSIDTFLEAVQTGQSESVLTISILLLIGFSVKAALMPLHVWAPKAYANSPMSFTSVFSGAMSKMGIFGMGIVFISVLKFGGSQDFSISMGGSLISGIVAWLGAITSAIATVYALKQNDAKKLLAYSSVAQLGYMAIGLAIGTELAVMSAIFLAVVHALFKGALFMAMGAVERQAGTTDMTKISGLINRMPWTFFVTLVSIISLASVPPLGGFVGKWMLYEALITSNHFFLVIIVFFSSTAAFLYSYRILFGIFLGQEEDDTAHVKEAPVSMLVPMVIMALTLMVLGTYPGILFEPIAAAMQSLGFENVNWSMTSLSNVWGNTVNLQAISYSIGGVFVIILAFLTLKGRSGTRGVSTKDISTSGEIPLENDNMTYQLDFFKPFERAVAPLYKRTVTKIYEDLGNGFEALFDFTRKIYTGNGQTYAVYVVAFLVAVLIYVQNTLSI